MAFRADLDQIGATLITLSMGAFIASAVVQHQILRSMRKAYPDKDRYRLARFNIRSCGASRAILKSAETMFSPA